MTKKETRLGGAANLRKKAEKITREKAALPPGNIEKMSPAKINRMLHELQVHQVELELQNEELCRAQAELDVAGARFFDFYDLAPVGYFTLSEKGFILEANLTAAKMFGVARRELVKQPLHRFILPADMDIYYLQHKQLFETISAGSGQAGETQVYELRMVKEDESTFWVRLDTIAARDTDGVPTCRIVMSNITASKLQEGALERALIELAAIKISEDIETHKYAEGMINTVRHPLIVLDQDLRVVTASHSFYEFFKVSPEDTVGKFIYTLGNKQWDIPALRELLETILPQHTTFQNYEVEHNFNTIGRRIMLLNAQQIQEVLSKERIILLAIEDITERKCMENELRESHKNLDSKVQERTRELVEINKLLSDEIAERKRTEDKLRESEERYRNLFENAHEAIFVAQDGNLVFLNSRTATQLGYSIEELKSKSFIDFIHPDDREMVIGIHIKRMRGKDLPNIYSFRVLHRDGSIRWVELNAVLINWHEKPATLNFMTDITKRLHAEEEKARLEKQLFQSQKMEAIGTMAGGVAHDFNNILGAIIGYAEMAMEEDQNNTRKKYLQETLNGAERAKDLVKQILTFSRKDSQEKKLLNINLLLKEAVKFLRASIPATIEIKQQLTKETCNIMADPTQMHQIIMNLCTNATHAMKRTGGIMKVELANIEISQGDLKSTPDLQPGPYIKLTVSDSGHGIDTDNIHRIFDPFFTTKSIDEGTGLGLSVVYGIVKNHGGFINVTSKIDEGTTFNVCLPRIIQEEATIGKMSGSIIGGTERILFVDDEPTLVDVGTHILTGLGYEVTGVMSSVEAQDLFHTKPQSFDLVITDMTLPKMNGIVLARKILKIRPDIPIILCSGIRESDTEEQAKSLGIRAYLTKPLARKELARVVRDTLDAQKKPLV